MSPSLLTGTILISAVLGTVGAPETTTTKADATCLFSYFKGNGEDGLHLAYSRDGLQWTALKKDRSFLTPQVGGRLMRDPCICQGPDATFHLVWTTGWWEKGIGIAHSKDLINWSEQQWLGVMEHEPNAVNCWAPEIFYDGSTQEYMIFWSTTIPGRFPQTDNTGDTGSGRNLNHRIYYVTTRDFAAYSQAKLLYDDGFNTIDATIVKDADKYIMFVKDETKQPVAKKNIRIAVSDRLQGPFGHASLPISPDWVEGPTALKVADEWYLYYDAYTRHRYEGARSKDLKHWAMITDKLSLPKGARHGTVFSVSEAVLSELIELK
jgi:beta-xylosidase